MHNIIPELDVLPSWNARYLQDNQLRYACQLKFPSLCLTTAMRKIVRAGKNSAKYNPQISLKSMSIFDDKNFIVSLDICSYRLWFQKYMFWSKNWFTRRSL